MLYTDSPYPPGTIAIARGELARYTDFDDSLDQLKVPRGTDIVRLKGASVARNRNMIVKDHFKTGEWLCFLDDDQVIPSDTIFKLLSHHKPIVGALYTTKHPPYMAVAMKARGQGLEYLPYSWTELARLPRLVPVVGCGTGCMVIQRSVFQQIPEPWFHYAEFSDDIYFCQKALLAGYEIFVDRDAPIGHTSTYNVWPNLAIPGVDLQMMWLRIGLSDDAGAADPQPGAGDST